MLPLVKLPLVKLLAQQSPQVQIQQLVDALYLFMEQSSLSQNRARCYIQWMLQLSRFHHFQHPTDLCQSDIETYLSSLAIDGSYSPETQQQAVKAFYFLYGHFLQIPLSNLRYSQIKKRRSFADRFGSRSCQQVIANLQPTSRLIAELALLGKLKLPQIVKLRLSDVDIKANRIAVRNTHGKIAFCLPIPLKLILDLRIQIMRVKQANQKVNYSTHSSDNQDLLFPLLNQPNCAASSRSMQLLLVKNDIKMAIEHYLQQSTQRPLIQTPQIVTQRLLGGFAGSTNPIRNPKRKPKDVDKNTQITFKLGYSQVQELNRGAA